VPVNVVFSEDGRDFLRRDWTHLVDADPDSSFFHTPRYLKLYWEEFGGSVDLRLAFAVGPGKEMLGAVALERSGRTIRFLGGTEVTDYMGPVGVPGHHAEIAEGLITGLLRLHDWDDADLIGLPEDSAWISALSGAGEASGLRTEVEEYDVAPILRLEPTFDSYLAALPSKLRHEVKRKARKLEGETGGYRIVTSNARTLSADLDTFVTLHRSSEGPKGRFMKPGMEIFFRRLGDAFLPTDEFRLSFVEVDGSKVAGAIAFLHAGAYDLYNSAFDHGWRHLSPGMVLIGDLIRESIEGGYRVFDFLKDGLEYKYRFGAVARRLIRVRLVRG
jgi:CelD/BcsL family acetyltransferase involved in cellulose biosynthesis